ncbi:hypothetical protein DPMN_000130 [Dreissena polymorpha]|uniref:Uncharacterized protein n=1 Tax=Dreissena polymorpha TaxID=45954 RepID=A0A9D4MHF4_DREPO|nr:hypothetical protein DPMN_000130 [Dreissena polymorpha]
MNEDKCLCVWKGLVHIHMHTKYEGNITRDIEVMRIFRNLNAKCDGKTDRQTDRQTDSPKGGIKTYFDLHIKNNFSHFCPIPCGHVFQKKWNHFQFLLRYFLRSNILSKFIHDRTNNKDRQTIEMLKSEFHFVMNSLTKFHQES